MNKYALNFIKETLKLKYSYNFKWLGIPYIQLPQDMIAIQEILWGIKPDYVIETGVAHGGGVVFCASILHAIGHGEVIGIECDFRIANENVLNKHPLKQKIQILKGSSTNANIIKEVQERTKNKKCVVILDSNHTHEHVLKELEAYKDIVSPGSFMIVLDTIIEYLPEGSFPNRPWEVGNNPMTAVRQFLQENKNYSIDVTWNSKLLITSAPNGYLRRTV